MESKKIFARLSANMQKFMELGDDWAMDSNINSAAQSRSYIKKIMHDIKPYIGASIKDADKVIAEQEALVAEQSEEAEEVFEEAGEEAGEEDSPQF